MLSPPCALMACSSAAALAAFLVVSTTKKPSLANFWAMAPPTPQRMPTGRWLSSSTFPCASWVLRPSACHLEVAPTTTATGLRVAFMVDSFPSKVDCTYGTLRSAGIGQALQARRLQQHGLMHYGKARAMEVAVFSVRRHPTWEERWRCGSAPPLWRKPAGAAISAFLPHAFRLISSVHSPQHPYL